MQSLDIQYTLLWHPCQGDIKVHNPDLFEGEDYLFR